VAAYVHGGAVTFLRSRRGAIVVCAALLLALFLFRPGAGRLKNRIANTISRALQRQVEIGSVHLHLLPSPGFDLENFVVHDDPNFSAEPVLRAEEVTAALRLTALFRARLEVSRLNLTEPSLNLVRNDQGHWNIESILEHTAQTSVAPTGRGASLTRPQFPYIEADRGRINFKLGSEKKPFALSEADYAFWQDSDTAWGMRLKAAPIRTDLNMSDTGVLRANGTWQRAGHLRETPVQFTVQWEGAQLGQVTKLLSGADRGWRGTLRTVIHVTGEPADLQIAGDASLDDFRRYDLAGGDPLRLSTHCDGRYSSVSRDFHDIRCLSPVGAGKLTVQGNIRRITSPGDYDLNISAEELPLSALALAVHRAKKDLPPDLQAEGALSFSAHLRREGAPADLLSVEGNGSTKDFKLESASSKSTIVLGEIPLVFTSQPAAESGRRARQNRNAEGVTGVAQPQLVLGPFHTNIMPALPIRAVLTPAGYSIAAAGDADVRRLLIAARTAGIPASPPVADGIAKVDLLLAGEWKGFGSPRALGTAQLKNSRIELRKLNGPLEIGSAIIQLQPERISIPSFTASLDGSHWKGSLSLPRACSRWSECPISFDLQADEIVPEKLRSFTDPSRPSPWYRVLSPAPNTRPAFLDQMRASGSIKAGRLVLPNLTASHITANVRVDSGHLHLSDLTADLFGGKHVGTWDVDFTAQAPLYAGNGAFKQVDLAQLAESMHDPWLTGTGNGEYRVEARGPTLRELLGTAAGSLKFDVHAGDLPHVVFEDSSLKVRRMAGMLTLRNGKFELQHGVLDSATGSYSVSGTASWSRELDFALQGDGVPNRIVTGTLAEPKVSATQTPTTRANLQR
jgi:AsmA family/AsmA-like C-terminal region